MFYKNTQQYCFDKAIIQVDKKYNKNYFKKQTTGYKQIKKHKIEVAKREQIFATRTEKTQVRMEVDKRLKRTMKATKKNAE